jgi:CRP-like cAMP-binding protein
MATTADIAAEIASTYLFSALAPADRRRIIDSAQVLRLGQGERLFDQGERASRFFLVRGGQVKLYRLSPLGQEKLIDIVGPGRTFAEAVMFMESGSYPVFAEALGPTELIAFDNETFRDLIRHSTATCFRLLASMSVHLQALLGEIEGLTLHNASFRVITYLLSHARETRGGTALRLDLPKSVLAARLSIKPETFSRILADLRDRGLITVQGQTITLRDREGLHRLLDG